MEEKSLKRVYAGYYTRWDKKRIYVVRVVKDIDTGEKIVISSSLGWMNRLPDIKNRRLRKVFSAGGGTGYFKFWRRDL